MHIAQLMPLSLASVKSRLVLPFWYWLTRVVPDKWACVCVCALVAVDTSSKPTGRLCYTFVYSVRTGRKRLPFSPKTSGDIARGWTDKPGTWKTV